MWAGPRSQLEGSKGMGQRRGGGLLGISHPSSSPQGHPDYLYHRPSLFPGMLNRAL